MPNIVSMAICKIKEGGTLEFNQELGKDITYACYHAMHEIVCHSAETFIQEDFEFQIIEEDVDSYQQVFHNNFHHVSDMWHENKHTNILFLDTDTLVVAPVEVFSGKFTEFQMFNYTDPKTLCGRDADNKYGLRHQHYFNAGVRYYPETMSEETWDLGWKYAVDWDYNIWGTEQIIFNEMMFSQNRDVNHWLRPEMGFQAMNLPFDNIDNQEANKYLRDWNGIGINDAKILHLHGTRGAGNTVLLQWNLWKRITGQEFEFTLLKVIKGPDGFGEKLVLRDVVQ